MAYINGKEILLSLQVTASEYGEDSPIPIEVTTETEMTTLLKNATSESVGEVYKYIGETTDTYENGALYIIAEE